LTGFFNIDDLKCIDLNDIYYLVPAIKNNRVIDAIVELIEKNKLVDPEYVMGGKRKNIKFVLFYLEKDNKIHAFATNKPIKENTPLKILEKYGLKYKKRWNIETGFTDIEDFQLRTTSQSLHLRLFYIFTAMVWYNLWKLHGIYAFEDEKVTKRFLRFFVLMLHTKGLLKTEYFPGKSYEDSTLS